MEMRLDVQGMEGVLATLNSLPAEVVSKRGGPVRSAALAGINVIKRRAQQNLNKVTANQRGTMKQKELRQIARSTGLTAKNIITQRKKPPFGTKGERYLLTVRYKAHPNYTQNRYRGRPIHFNDIAFMLEYGTSNQPAEPWLRPAYLATKEQAVVTFQTTLLRRLDKVVEELARKNATKG